MFGGGGDGGINCADAGGKRPTEGERLCLVGA